jgi:hypothetical protein
MKNEIYMSLACKYMQLIMIWEGIFLPILSIFEDISKLHRIYDESFEVNKLQKEHPHLNADEEYPYERI